VEPIIGGLVEIGVDALDNLQACNTHAKELKALYGDRLTFCGGFNTNGVPDSPKVPIKSTAFYRKIV